MAFRGGWDNRWGQRKQGVDGRSTLGRRNNANRKKTELQRSESSHINQHNIAIYITQSPDSNHKKKQPRKSGEKPESRAEKGGKVRGYRQLSSSSTCLHCICLSPVLLLTTRRRFRGRPLFLASLFQTRLTSCSRESKFSEVLHHHRLRHKHGISPRTAS